MRQGSGKAETATTELASETPELVDEWSLSTDQMIFMLQHHNEIEAAFADEDVETLRALAASEEFIAVFGTMGFDEAFDRYETMIEAGRADT